MPLDYLIYLAGMRAVDIHPGGWKATLALFEALELQAGNRVLEIGCGTGGTIMRLLHDHPVQIYGIDITDEMLVAARERLRYAGSFKHAHLVRASITTLPYPANIFDKVYAESVLGFQDIVVVRKMLGEIRRVLKPGGLFAANEAIWKPQVEAERVAEINRSCEADFGLRQATDLAWDIDDWTDAIQASGFGICSANLIEEHLSEFAQVGDIPLVKGSLTSRLLTRYFRIRSYINLRVMKQHLVYGRRLQNHRGDGQFIEVRLFILQKV